MRSAQVHAHISTLFPHLDERRAVDCGMAESGNAVDAAWPRNRQQGGGNARQEAGSGGGVTGGLLVAVAGGADAGSLMKGWQGGK